MIFLNILVSVMVPKQTINDDHCVLKKDWTKRLFFIKLSGKLLCLICNKTITDNMKEYNVRLGHYENEHKVAFENLTVEFKKKKKQNKTFFNVSK